LAIFILPSQSLFAQNPFPEAPSFTIERSGQWHQIRGDVFGDYPDTLEVIFDQYLGSALMDCGGGYNCIENNEKLFMGDSLGYFRNQLVNRQRGGGYLEF
jgi:hypothetical protein